MNNGKLRAVASEAVQVFTKLHPGAAVSCGPHAGTMEGLGKAGAAVSIDCAHTNRRIAMMTLDEKPGVFAIGVADKRAPSAIQFSERPISELTTQMALAYMDKHFQK